MAFASVTRACTGAAVPDLRRLSDRFAEAASACGSIADLRSLLAGATEELGFKFFALLHHASLRKPSGALIRIDNYPESWSAEFIAKGFDRSDPVHWVSRRSSFAFRWSELGRLTQLEGEGAVILERSRGFGLGEGVTVPFNVPGEPSGSCSFVARAGHEVPTERVQYAEWMGARAFEAARRIVSPRPAGPPPHLSRRELECLRLVAAGKADREIAIILGLSADTVRQYVKRARAAYDVTTRTQLVVLGLRDGRIDFEEALDARLGD